MRNVEYGLHFSITNPQVQQTSPSISILALVNGFNISEAAMIKPGTSLLGVEGGADPLTFVIPTFTAKIISQDTLLPAVANTLSIFLQTNVELTATSVVVISGLENARVYGSSVGLVGSTSTIFCDAGGQAQHADWDNATWSLTLQVCTGQRMVIDTLYEFSIDVRNPDQGQVSPAVSIEATGVGVNIEISAMTKGNGV